MISESLAGCSCWVFLLVVIVLALAVVGTGTVAVAVVGTVHQCQAPAQKGRVSGGR